VTAGRVGRTGPGGARRWLLFVHQVPSEPSNLRVRTWRRLQQLGAIAIKQAVYVLPESAEAREDFQWLKTEIEAGGGQASVFAADSVDAWSDDGLVEEFRASRQRAYEELAAEVEAWLRPPRGRRPRTPPRTAAARVLDGLRERLAAIDRVDFFGSIGRDRVVTLLDTLTARATGPSSPVVEPSAGTRRTPPRGALWLTRPRPGVDRMSSAWLIRRFIDPEARFAFAADPAAAPEDAVPFDMFGVDFSHHGAHCTFETLCDRFAIQEPSVTRVAAIVHDLDLKDARFNLPETATVGLLVDGLQLAVPDDHDLLERGIGVFDALHRAFEQRRRARGRAPEPRGAGRSGKVRA